MMDIKLFEKINQVTWEIKPKGKMRVPAVIYASQELIENMDHKVYEQLTHVAQLPGIVDKAYAMPDAHWGYGFPIGGVAAFDPDQGGVVSAGGVGFDISCGVRLLTTGLKLEEFLPQSEKMADLLYEKIPSGVGSQSFIRLNNKEMNEMLCQGVKWAIQQGYGELSDLELIEEKGVMVGASPNFISEKAKVRQTPEMGTLGSGNHYLEVQEVKEVFHREAAQCLGIEQGDIVVSIHCGSRGLGHQIGTDYLKEMLLEAKKNGLSLPDRELACAPILSETGRAYLGAMRGAMNCAMANRQIISCFTKEVFNKIFPRSKLKLVYDVSHNTCKCESHSINGIKKELFVHRKGATRAYGPGHVELPEKYKKIGQPVFIGGSMGMGSYILVGTSESEALSLSSACHGAGRMMSRTQAMKKWDGKQVIEKLKKRGIFIRSGSFRGVAEEAPEAYKDLHSVAISTEQAKLALRVAHLSPHVCIKG